MGTAPFSVGWLIQWGGCWNSQTHSYSCIKQWSMMRVGLAVPASSRLIWMRSEYGKARLRASFLSQWRYYCFINFSVSTSRHDNNFYCASAYWRAILIANLSVRRLSVRLSVRYVPVPDENSLTYRHSFFSRYGSPIILVLQHQTSSRNTEGSPPAGALNTGGV